MAPSESDVTVSQDSDMSDVSLLSLAKLAGDRFKENKYEDCISVLRAIQKRKPDDPKVLHNTAIAEYYREGCVHPENLLLVLSKVNTRASELKREEAGNDEESSSGSVTGSGSGNPEVSAGGSSTSSALWTEDYDSAIAAVNTGITYYHLQQYASASALLEAIFRNIEPIDESAAFWVCLLLLEMKLATRQVDKAAAILAYVEKAFCYLLSSGDGVVSPSSSFSAPQLAASGSASTEQTPTNTSTGSSTETPSVGSLNRGEDELTRAALEEGLDEEALKLTIELQRGEPAGGVGRSGTGPGAVSKRGESASKVLSGPSAEVNQMVHMYKARLLLLTRNMKAAKREVKAAGNVAHEGVQTVFLLKAYMEFCRENYRKCIKVLTGNMPSVTNLSDTALRSHLTAMTLSNLGCVHHRLGKSHLASLYFSQALKCANMTTASSQKPAKGSVLSTDHSLSILYNAGLQQLLHGKAPLAARCFQKCTPLFYNRPILWLRLAECCVVAHDRGQLVDTPSGQQQLSAKKDDKVLLVVVGGGRWRRLVLPAAGLQRGAAGGGGIRMSVEGLESEGASKVSGSFAVRVSEATGSLLPSAKGPVGEAGVNTNKGVLPELSLEYGRLCLRNALHLLDREEQAALASSSSPSEGKEGGESQPQGEGNSSLISVQSEGSSLTNTGDNNRSSGGDAGGPVAESSREDNNGESQAVDRDEKPMGSATLATNSATLEAEKSQQRNMLRTWALCSLCYTELCLNNPLASLTVARELLEIPACPAPYLFLAHTYAAESLCLLDRPKEAGEHLSTCLVEHTTNPPSLNLTGEGERKWRSGNHSEGSGEGEEGGGGGGAAMEGIGRPVEGMPDLNELTGPTAKASLYVNLAAVYAMQGELAQAHQCALQALSVAPANPLSMLAVVYVELCRGQTDDALAMLKHCRHVCVGHVSKGQIVVGQ